MRKRKLTKKKPSDAKKRPRTKTRAPSQTKSRVKRAERGAPEVERENVTGALLRELSERTGVSPADTGGDVDADWQRAQSSGEETVGGSVATPDQDVVDELARPFGVERPTDAPVITSHEILSSRDRRRWRASRAETSGLGKPRSPEPAQEGVRRRRSWFQS